MSDKKRLYFFLAICAMMNIGANLTHPVTPTIFKNLNLGDYMFGYAMAAMMLMNFIVSPFWGEINGYISSRVSLLIGSIGYSLGQLLFAFATTEWQFILVRMFTGIFAGGVLVSMLTYLVNVLPDEKRGYYLTVNVTIQSVFGAFGYLIGGTIGAYNPYLSVFVQVGLLFFCGVAFFLVCKNDAKSNEQDLKISTLMKKANPLSSFIAGKQFLTAGLISIFVMCALQNMSFTAFDQSFNYYMRDIFAFPSSYNGALKGAMGIITLIANGTVGLYIIKKTDVKKSNIVIFTLSSISMLLAVFFTEMAPFISFCVLVFAFNAIGMPILQNILSTSSKKHDSNLIMGFYNAMRSLGGIVGAFVSGMLYNLNPLFPFILVACGSVLAMIFGIFYFKISTKISTL